MRLFARKAADVPAAVPEYAEAEPAPAVAGDAEREWRHMQRAEHQQHKRQAKEHKRRLKRSLKQLRGAAKHLDKLRRRQEHRARQQARLLRRRERERRHAARRLQRHERRRQRRQLQQEQQLQALITASTDTELLSPPPLLKQPRCAACSARFQALSPWRHHCRNCGRSFCRQCLSRKKRPIPWFQLTKPQKICLACDLTVFSGRGRTPTAATVPAPAPLSLSTSVPLPLPMRTADTANGRTLLPPLVEPSSSPVSANPASEGSASAPREAVSAPVPKRRSKWLLPLRPFLKRKASADRLRRQQQDDQLEEEKLRANGGSAERMVAMTSSA